jgi:hypothetical protein
LGAQQQASILSSIHLSFLFRIDFTKPIKYGMIFVFGGSATGDHIFYESD